MIENPTLTTISVYLRKHENVDMDLVDLLHIRRGTFYDDNVFIGMTLYECVDDIKQIDIRCLCTRKGTQKLQQLKTFDEIKIAVQDI